MAIYQAYKQGRVKEAAKNCLQCIQEYPLMAEFWCLLGDIHYKATQYEKASIFYENALILGGQRKDDDMPVEVPKYKQYPTKMMESCLKIINNSKAYQEIKS